MPKLDSLVEQSGPRPRQKSTKSADTGESPRDVGVTRKRAASTSISHRSEQPKTEMPKAQDTEDDSPETEAEAEEERNESESDNGEDSQGSDDDYDPATTEPANSAKSRGRPRGKTAKAVQKQSTTSRNAKGTKGKPQTKTLLRAKGVEARKLAKGANQKVMQQESKIQELEEKINELEQDKKELIEKNWEHEAPGFRFLRDDSIIRDDFKSLSQRCSTWATEHAKKSMLGESLDAVELGKVVSALHGSDDLHKCCIFIETKLEALFWILGGCRLVVEALLLHAICFHVVMQPTFFLKEDKVNVYDTRTLEDSFLDIYTKMGGENPRGAKIFRAEAMRGFFPNTRTTWVNALGGNKADLQSEDVFKDSRRKFYERFAGRLLGSPICLLLKAADEKEGEIRRGELIDILRAASLLTIHFSRQNVDVKCFGCRSSDLKTPFSVNSRDLEPHRRMKLSIGDPRIEGEIPDGCIRPAIWAYSLDKDEDKSAGKNWLTEVALIISDSEWENRKLKFLAINAQAGSTTQSNRSPQISETKASEESQNHSMKETPVVTPERKFEIEPEQSPLSASSQNRLFGRSLAPLPRKLSHGEENKTSEIASMLADCSSSSTKGSIQTSPPTSPQKGTTSRPETMNNTSELKGKGTDVSTTDHESNGAATPKIRTDMADLIRGQEGVANSRNGRLQGLGETSERVKYDKAAEKIQMEKRIAARSQPAPESPKTKITNPVREITEPQNTRSKPNEAGLRSKTPHTQPNKRSGTPKNEPDQGRSTVPSGSHGIVIDLTKTNAAGSDGEIVGAKRA